MESIAILEGVKYIQNKYASVKERLSNIDTELAQYFGKTEKFFRDLPKEEYMEYLSKYRCSSNRSQHVTQATPVCPTCPPPSAPCTETIEYNYCKVNGMDSGICYNIHLNSKVSQIDTIFSSSSGSSGVSGGTGISGGTGASGTGTAGTGTVGSVGSMGISFGSDSSGSSYCFSTMPDGSKIKVNLVDGKSAASKLKQLNELLGLKHLLNTHLYNFNVDYNKVDITKGDSVDAKIKLYDITQELTAPMKLNISNGGTVVDINPPRNSCLRFNNCIEHLGGTKFIMLYRNYWKGSMDSAHNFKDTLVSAWNSEPTINVNIDPTIDSSFSLSNDFGYYGRGEVIPGVTYYSDNETDINNVTAYANANNYVAVLILGTDEVKARGAGNVTNYYIKKDQLPILKRPTNDKKSMKLFINKTYHEAEGNTKEFIVSHKDWNSIFNTLGVCTFDMTLSEGKLNVTNVKDALIYCTNFVEDPRIFKHPDATATNKFYVTTQSETENNFGAYDCSTTNCFSMNLLELTYDPTEETVELEKLHQVICPDKSFKIEKNWSAFYKDSELYFYYTFDKRKVLKYNANVCTVESELTTGPAELMKLSNEIVGSNITNWTQGDIVIKLSTPSLQLDDNTYISVGHISVKFDFIKKNPEKFKFLTETAPLDALDKHANHPSLIYFMMFFTFDKNTYEVKKISNAFIPTSKSIFSHTPYLLAFPSGFIELDTNTYLISYGEGDERSKLMAIEKGEVTKLLRPIPKGEDYKFGFLY